MIKNNLRYFSTLAILVFIFNSGYSQKLSESGFNLGLKLGASKLLGEIPNGFSEVINEFDNKIGFASAFEISKYISPRWEISSDISYSSLNGNTFSPEFSAEGIHWATLEPIDEPVEYLNKLLGFNLFFRYFFKPAYSESVFIPFISAGGGYIKYYSKFKYIEFEDGKILFGKGTEGYSKLSTPVFSLGTGFKTSLSSKFYLVTSIDFNMVNYDFLDVVHNYDEDGNRLDLTGLYSEFKIGIFYNFSKSVGNKNNKNGNSLPFSR